jgi:type I restriction enzyme S subunit
MTLDFAPDGRWVKLGEIADVQTGPFGSQLHAADYVADGVPSIMPVNIGENRVDATDIARVAEVDVRRLERYRVAVGDIVYSRRGDVERRALIRDSEAGWLCGTGCLRVRFTNGVNPLYASYYLGHPDVRRWIIDHAIGATMPNLNTSILSALPVFLPSVDEQRLIAQALGALDEKIELNRRIAATAHELAHAIFRSRYRSDDPRLPHEPLGEHVEVARGLSYTGGGLADDGVPLHNLNSLHEGGGYKRDGIKYYTGHYQPRHLVEPGDVVVATVEQGFEELLIGFPARIPRCFETSGIFSQDLFRLRPRDGSPLERSFVYLMLLRGHLHEEIAGYANGTTINRIPVEALQKPRFAVPPRALVEEVDALVTPLYDRAEAAEDESETLAQLRDTLLPKLISGDLRLRDVGAS